MEEKIRLAVFGQKRLSREGGIEIVVKELCTRMAQNGCDITCYNRAGHSYYVLPERPDLAALFCWQAINHSYYVQQLGDNNVGYCLDTKGIELVRDAILGGWDNKYKAILEPFLKRMTCLLACDILKREKTTAGAL